MKTSDFDFDLPLELIASYPLAKRSSSRLLWLEQGCLKHQAFAQLPELLRPDDLLVFNNTKVIPARLLAFKETGGKVEILIERVLGTHAALAHLRSNKALKVPAVLVLPEGTRVKVEGKTDGFYRLQFECNDLRTLLGEIGSMPLPPYIKRTAEELDDSRYQTIYSQEEGAVAAPTAGLHFDEQIFGGLANRGIQHTFLTLHVGTGTFKPVAVEDFKGHVMHKEIVVIPQGVCDAVNAQRARGGRVIAVGTTSVRALETAMQGQEELRPHEGETNIFIHPGYKFRCVDALITNFHLPRSTLIMLVCALGGYEPVMAAYQEAIKQQYRFYSYGDAMFVVNARSSHEV